MPDPTVCLQRSCWVHALVNLSCFGSSMQVTNKHNAIRFWPIDIWVFWHKMVYNVLLIHPSTHSHLHADGGKPKPIKDTLAEELKPNMHFVEILTFPETWALLYHMTTIKLWWKDKKKKQQQCDALILKFQWLIVSWSWVSEPMFWLLQSLWFIEFCIFGYHLGL